MNLRKSRFSSGQKRNLSFKDIKSSVKKGSKGSKYTKEIKCSSKSILKTPTKHQKSILDDSLTVKTSDINLVTSTPIPCGVRKRMVRSSRQCNSDEISKVNLSNGMSYPITSTPIPKTLIQTKPCEVRLFSLKIMRKSHSNKCKPDFCLRSKERSFNCKLSHSILNSPVEVLSKNVRRSTRNKKVVQSQNVSENVPNDIKMPQSQKSKYAKNISFSSQKHLNDSPKSGEKVIAPQNKIQSKNKKTCTRKSSTCCEKIAFIRSSASKDISSVSENSTASEKTFYSKKKVRDKKKSSTKTKKLVPSLSSQNKMFVQAKSLFEPSSNIVTRSSYTLRIQNGQSSKKTTVNKSSSQSNITLHSQHSSRKASTEKQSSVKKNEHQNKTSKTINKKAASSSKKQKSDESDKFQHKCLTFSGDIPIDDLALSVKFSEGRKVKSDGFKLPAKNTLKRKRSAIDAIKKADEDYEDDIYESKTFDQFKDLLMDTSDSERSFAVSTPKFPITPLIHHKTPKFKDCFSPTEYAISRKAAMEYIYRNKKRKGCQKSETPVRAEKKKLDYSQALEDAQKLQKTLENLAEEESDNDSYFSFG